MVALFVRWCKIVDINNQEKGAIVKIVTRMEAAKSGLNRFFTGKPCRNGHIAERYVINGTCVECANNSAKRHNNEFVMALRAAKGDV